MDDVAIFEPGSLPGAPSCHCSSLLELPSGDLLAVWYAGTREKHPDVAVWGSKWSRREGAWSRPAVVANTPGHSEGNPVLYGLPGGSIRLFFQTMHHGRVVKGGWSVCTIKFQDSHDGGATWTEPRFLRRLWFWIIRCKPLRLPSGRTLLPVHRELGTYQAHFHVNDDPSLEGRWRRVGRLKVPGGALEPSVCRLPDGTLLCALRTTKAGRVHVSNSDDDGNSWSKPRPTNVPNPNSQVDVLCTKRGTLLMACNPIERGRGELALVRSTDGGTKWDLEGRRVVQREAGAEFSYPCLLQTSDGTVHCTYTHRRASIHHLTFKEDELFGA
ncbi:MAG: exo-alpha-sialidase [Promethearchaeota archaeon]